MGTRGVAFLVLALSTLAGAFKLPALAESATRRHALGLGVAALVAPLSPAFARTKASTSPNKPEGVGANAKSYQLDQYKQEYEGMKGDKGSRGVASAKFDAEDTVQRNRDQNGGLARDKDGKKITVANRSRSPEELGLKQWSGY